MSTRDLDFLSMIQTMLPTELIVGELVSIVEEGSVPIVVLNGERDMPGVRARSVVGLNVRHIGAKVAVLCERGDPQLPVIVGVLRGEPGWPLDDAPGNAQADLGVGSVPKDPQQLAPLERKPPDASHMTGKLVGFSGKTPLVLPPGNGLRPALRARTIARLTSNDIGQQVLLALPDGHDGVPVILGRLHDDPFIAEARCAVVGSENDELILLAQERLVLSCGKARLTLLKDGTVRLEGVTVLSEATGANRVRGATIELN